MSPREHDRLVSNATAGVRSVAWHALLWLVLGNAIGTMIAVLLLAPGLNHWLGEWTYGRWITVHMNIALYGWCSLPMAGFLFKVYGADRGATAAWCRPVVWAWSAALGVGAISWLEGHSSGKLFLDWSGTARISFPLTMFALWLLLAIALVRNWMTEATSWAVKGAKLLGLGLLLAVPFLIYFASNPSYYPAINPDTGGPTGTSQLESSLAIVAILLLLPFGLTRQKTKQPWAVRASWMVLAAEALLCATLSRADMSHHQPAQFLSLGSLLVWVALIPAYYAAFKWNANTRRWRNAMLSWWGLLVVSGWVLFLPGILDHFKFTDGLVGHSFTAMAGFVSALVIFAMVQLMGDDGWIFNRGWSFIAWNAGVLAYVAVMMTAGWMEGFDPAFTIVPGFARNLLYTLRLMTGLMMLAASLEWLVDAASLGHEAVPVATRTAQEKIA
jgi:cytochrome c oxidase cbb3-type subunit 1